MKSSKKRIVVVLIRLIKESASRIVTHPLRAVTSTLRHLRQAAYDQIFLLLRRLWRFIPIPQGWKYPLKNFVFCRLGFMFRNKPSYLYWQNVETKQEQDSCKVALPEAEDSPVSKASRVKETINDSEQTPLFVEEKNYFDLSAGPVENTPVKAIAFYLPQFHSIPENDEWWGEGFTEWTNTRKGGPLFDGHHQPRTPSYLGHYNLENIETYEKQVALAKKAGIFGFCFYFYWFGGKTLLEKPLRNILANPQIDQPFCLCWANENWTRRWDGQDEEVLISQQHSEKDAIAFLNHVNRYFKDDRYIKIDGKPLLVVYRPGIIPDIIRIQKLWRKQAKDLGWPGIYLASAQTFGQKDPRDFNFDSALQFPPHNQQHKSSLNLETPGLLRGFKGSIFDYRNMINQFCNGVNPDYKVFRCVTLGWDNTARRGENAIVLNHFSLTRYAKWLLAALKKTLADPKLSDSEKFVFINAWNEWAEGTYLEPDSKYGFGYLEATKKALNACTHKDPACQ